MSEKLTTITFDAQTGEITERELTSEEIKEREALNTKDLQDALKLKAKQDARQSALAKLAALGLTEAEIAAL
jgi:hypothetical protein